MSSSASQHLAHRAPSRPRRRCVSNFACFARSSCIPSALSITFAERVALLLQLGDQRRRSRSPRRSAASTLMPAAFACAADVGERARVLNAAGRTSVSTISAACAARSACPSRSARGARGSATRARSCVRMPSFVSSVARLLGHQLRERFRRAAQVGRPRFVGLLHPLLGVVVALEADRRASP